MNKFVICCSKLNRMGESMIGGSSIDLARRLLKKVYDLCPTIEIPDISHIEGRVCVIDWELDDTCVRISEDGVVTVWDSWARNDLETVAQMLVERLAPTVVFKPKSELDELIERIVNTKLSDLEDRVREMEIEVKELKRSLNGIE